jgi:hypothetical protein
LDIQRFKHFCKTYFQVEERAGALSDARSDPHIGVACIFLSVFYMGVLGLGSLLGLDQFLRTSKGKKLFRCGRALVSDSTLSRSLVGFGLAGLQALLETIYALGRHLGVGRCEVTHGRLRVGVIDGSCFGRFRASCFAQIGSVCLMGGLEPISTFGKELPASTRLVRRLIERFGPRWIDLALLDGLYVAQGFLRVCLEEGQLDVLIKTQEEGLNIIQDAMGLFRHYSAYAKDIEHIQGTDLTRLRAYEVYALGGFFLEGVQTPFKVAWVREEDLRTGEKLEFWVLTSLQELTAGQMRELAHWRWDIENNGFKMLNALVHTKHLYAHHPHAAEAVLLILFMAGNLLQLFLAHLSPEEIEARFGKVKNTRRFLQGELRDSLADLPLPDT